MIDIDRWEARMTRRDDEPLLPPSPEEVLTLIAEVLRLQGILSAYNGTTKEQLMARVDKLEQENRALGKMLGERKAHRKCPCGGLGGIKKMHGKYWAECNNCECSTDTLDTPEEAWAAWDGVE